MRVVRGVAGVEEDFGGHVVFFSMKFPWSTGLGLRCWSFALAMLAKT